MSDTKKIDVLIIGAGPAGVAAGIGARKEGTERVVVLERDWDLGGIHSNAYIRALVCVHSKRN